MSATTLEEKQLPVFIVQGPNWTCEIKLNEMNAEFPHREQAYEAATKAIEVFKGLTENHTFEVKDISKEPPLMAEALWVFLKDTDEQKTGLYVESYIAMANGGFYKDSRILYDLFVKRMKKIQEEDKARAKTLEADIQKFEAFQKSLKKTAPTKAVKKAVKKIVKKKKK